MDATADLGHQKIFKLAKQYVDKTKTIGVFTKCDLLSQANDVVTLPFDSSEPLGGSRAELITHIYSDCLTGKQQN